MALNFSLPIPTDDPHKFRTVVGYVVFSIGILFGINTYNLFSQAIEPIEIESASIISDLEEINAELEADAEATKPGGIGYDLLQNLKQHNEELKAVADSDLTSEEKAQESVTIINEIPQIESQLYEAVPYLKNQQEVKKKIKDLKRNIDVIDLRHKFAKQNFIFNSVMALALCWWGLTHTLDFKKWAAKKKK